MKPVSIFSGKLTAKGNLTGYNAAGERIHVSAQQLASINMVEAKDLKFPLYALTVEREFNKRDENNKDVVDPTTGLAVTFKREQAGSIFVTKAEMITAMNSDKLISIEAATQLNTAVTESGLTAETLQLLSVGSSIL